MMDENKKNILKEIMTNEEAHVLRLKRLVEVAKPFLRVEEKTGAVIILQESKFTNSDRIFLLLLGKYFAAQYEILKDYSLSLSNISTELRIKRTTLPSPLKMLIKEGVVERPKENNYRVNPYKAEYLLCKLSEKYLVGKKT